MTAQPPQSAPEQSSSALVNQWSEVMLHTYRQSIGLVSGDGALLHGDDGTEYLDLLAGIAVASLGQAHPAVVDAVTTQMKTLVHCSNLFASKPAIHVATALLQRLSPGNPERQASGGVFFCNSGAEANEAAFKLSRLTGKTRILAAKHGFHGRTMGSLAMTGQPDKQVPFEPLPGFVEFFNFNDAGSLSHLLNQAPGTTAAVIVEPIQGETGIIPAEPGFLQDVQELCRAHDALFIVDEVQTGIGRTGAFAAHLADGVEPDIVTFAKGLGGGLPIGACVAFGRAAELFTPGSHGTTFGGNPVACAAADAVLRVIDDDFIAAVASKGASFSARLARIPGVELVRGRGLMLGMVLDKPVAKEAVTIALKHGLIINAPSDQVIRITPPLTITEQQLDTAVHKLSEVVADARRAVTAHE